MDQIFTVSLKVRDYECDMADGVNNSVYFNYLEHGRHEYLKSIGIDFAEFARQKIGLVVIRAELDYKVSLVSGDEFTVSASMERTSKLRFQFNQEIRRGSDQKLCVAAKIMGTAIDARGRPRIPDELEKILSKVCVTPPVA
jgi:acyl-CoA thioester hydrolase